MLLRARRAFGQRRIGRRYRLAGGFERVYLHHVRKTGGTSVSESFLALGGEEPLALKRRMREGWGMARSGEYVFAAHARRALRGGRYLFGWSHIPAWDLDLPPHTYRVTILRDPAARVVSLYRYLSDPGSDEGQPYPAPAAQRAIAAEGFDRFLDRLPEPELLAQLHMFSAALDPAEAAAGVAECSLAFRIEEMESGLATLSELIGRPLEARHERRSARAFEPSGDQAAHLRERLTPEYELIRLLSRRARPGRAL
jgi:hypothetical protein